MDRLLPKVYDPKTVEEKWYRFWLEYDYFHAEVDAKAKPYALVIPPPNVTGKLHLGHALNNTLQDILVRYHRMKGENAMWIPGTDHAGIAPGESGGRVAKEGLTGRKSGARSFERVWQ